MSDSKDPLDLNEGDQNNPKKDIKDLKLVRIAIAYLNRNVEEDTPPEDDGPTALDKLIINEFKIKDDENFNSTLERLKAEVNNVLAIRARIKEDERILGGFSSFGKKKDYESRFTSDRILD